MASIRKELVIAASPDEVWAALRDVGAAHRLFRGVLVDTHLEGNARVVRFANGMVVRELIVDVDDQARRLAYAAVGGRTIHHHATFEVSSAGEARTKVVWITDLLPDDLVGTIRVLVEQGAAAMRETLERRREDAPRSRGDELGNETAMRNEQPAPERKGVTVKPLAAVDLGPEIEGMAGRQLRMRMVTIEPGGAFGPVHDHKDRPGTVYVLQGTITDHRDGVATDYGPGVGWPEDRNTTHWLENRGTTPAVEISVDIVRQE